MANNDSRLDKQEINVQLSKLASALISEFVIFPFIDSTNTYLMEVAQTNAQSGCVCFAETQTAGKGRRGRQWISPKGQNIYGSFLWRFENAQALNGLSLAIGVGVIRALNKLGIFNVNLKWPNDIYSEGKKLGGILIEVTTHSDNRVSAVIGLGLNVHLPTKIEQITQAYTDLNTITDIELNRNQLVAQLLNELLPIAATFEKQGFSAYLNEWREQDCLFGKTVTLFVGSQKLTGIVQGIDENGLLKLQRDDGTIQIFASGEVSFSA